MPTVFGDRLSVGGQVITIDCHSLGPWLASLPRRSCGRLTPSRQSGYMASWALIENALHLVEISGQTVAPLFAHLDGRVPAEELRLLLPSFLGPARLRGG